MNYVARARKVHKLNSHKTAVDLYSRPHGPTAWQADDVMLIRIFQDGCAVHDLMKLESARGRKVIVKNFFLKFYLFHFSIGLHTKQAKSYVNTFSQFIMPGGS